MWTYNTDYNKWFANNDSLLKNDFDYLKQELKSTRLYSRCLSGASYLPVNDLTNIYDILGSYKDRNWYISTNGSPYSVTTIPAQFATPIDSITYTDYSKYLSEYGLTLKTLFTPYKLIKDSSKNFYYVDVATTFSIDLATVTNGYKIDGVLLKEGHRVLVKDQVTNVVLLNTADPKLYFTGNYKIIQNLGATIEYQYYNQENGIYKYTNGSLVRESDLDKYEQCIRYSVSVKLGTMNSGKQFHLSRLLNGYYPMVSLSQPIEFKEKHNWILRNRVDYNNLFEINYYDIIKHGTQIYNHEGTTYSIPERTLSIGEFGVILNTQEGKSNIIKNKYKVNLRSISQTSKYYWMCGDENILLRVRKHDFFIDRIVLDDIPSILPQLIKTNLRSVSFYDDLNGVVVGELNTILYTNDGGFKWNRLEISDFSEFDYNKALYTTANRFFVAGDTGVLVEFVNSISGWTAYKRRISKVEDSLDEYLLVENINDLYKTKISSWNVSYSYFQDSIQSDKELLFLSTDNGNIIAYDINNSFSAINNDFIYFDFGQNYKDIKNITRKDNTDYFYFTGVDPITGNDSIFSFDINNFSTIGVGSSYSNTTIGISASVEYFEYPNKIFDYNGIDFLICGNNSLLGTSTYSSSFISLDSTFEDKLKSKLLVLDYDIASKLNFFTDQGEYRLPNSITFSNIGLTALGGGLSFSTIKHNATSTNNGTYSETNWLTYWKDDQKTFEYYSNFPLDESTQVLLSTDFIYSPTYSYGTYTQSQITSSASLVSMLAPSILDENASRYLSTSTSITEVPSSIYRIFLYDYLMIYKVSSAYNVSVGDVLNFESNVVNTQLIVNKIVQFQPGGFKYLYAYTEFNQNIINDLTNSPSSVTIVNLNRYSTRTQLRDRFNLHPISNAYKLEFSDSIGNISSNGTGFFKISPKFNNLTSYYNLQTNVFVNGSTQSMLYTDSFLKFGYSPTYNLLDYLTSINNVNDINPKFFATKEYLSMPIYKGIPLDDLTETTTYIDYNGMTYSGVSTNLPVNKILFGSGLKLEWDSIFLNTFVDIKVSGVNNYLTEKLLVTNKYYDSIKNAYVIEFHKRILPITSLNNSLSGHTLDIISRRKLSQISSDLQYLNNIQREKGKSNSWQDNPASPYSYETYQNELNYKIPTDSYAKILLSDSDTVKLLSGIIYVDYKNELAMNITRLAREYNIPVVNTMNYNGKLYIACSQNHGLQTGDGVVLDFIGGVGSSQELNPQYSGYHVITKINATDFVTDINYGTLPTVGLDTGYVRYTKQDPFFNFEPVDLIDLGIDGKGKMALELSTDNLKLSGGVYSLINVDFEKYRFRLIDGLNIDTVNTQFSWLLEAELSNALIGLDSNGLVWYSGTWQFGRWFGGTWMSGVWMSGDWYGGIWNSNKVVDNKLSATVNNKTVDFNQSIWYSGRWYDGTWNGGVWVNGRWYGGTWNDGMWHMGTWNDGTWNKGNFEGGIWVLGTWNSGVFNCDNGPAYWLDGKWYGGDFENGMWYNGYWEQKRSLSRFGTKSFNSRTSTWHAGTWVSGSFYSFINTNDQGILDVSDVHKYSIWRTGKWLSGEWYGGIAYNMDFKTGTWYGGILEDIEVIGIDTSYNTFTLNGIFKFNTGDVIYIIDNQLNNIYSSYGSNLNPGKYKVLYQVEDPTNDSTIVYVDSNLSGSSAVNINTGLRVVSKFNNLNWKTGIWTNGLYDNGLWESGIWYNGVFNAVWS